MSSPTHWTDYRQRTSSSWWPGNDRPGFTTNSSQEETNEKSLNQLGEKMAETVGGNRLMAPVLKAGFQAVFLGLYYVGWEFLGGALARAIDKRFPHK